MNNAQLNMVLLGALALVTLAGSLVYDHFERRRTTRAPANVDGRPGLWLNLVTLGLAALVFELSQPRAKPELRHASGRKRRLPPRKRER